MNMIHLKIDNHEIEVPEGTTILEAAKNVQVDIPTLCHHPDLIPNAGCGICIVKVNGRMLRSCCTACTEGMDVITRDPDIVEARRTVLKLILSHHPNECLTCLKNGCCELQDLATKFHIPQNSFMNIVPTPEDLPLDDSTKCIQLDPRKCILCGRCVQVCQKVQNIWALSFLERSVNTHIAPAGGVCLGNSPCIKCGQCTAHCPTGALTEVDETERVWKYLQDPAKHCVVQIAPSIRVALGEAFGYKSGELVTGKLYAALRRMGFDAVFDTNFGADLTIMEEASEFVERFTKAPEKLPLITSCCPAWVDYLEKFDGSMIPHFSTAKSPQAMLGVLAKTYYAQKKGLDPKDIVVVSIMPCTAKKFEIIRSEEMFLDGVIQNVDVSLTTRETVRMIKQMGIEFRDLPEETADSPLGQYSGAGTIFGFSGGVMEAALRTAHFLITGSETDDLEIRTITDLDKGVKELTMQVADKEVRIGVAHGIANVEYLLNKVKAAKVAGEETPYHFIEVMACPGGCIGGGGQPLGVTQKIRKARQQGLMKDDEKSKVRRSHQNPDIQKLYDEFLGHPLSEKAHELLHTHYVERPLYKR